MKKLFINVMLLCILNTGFAEEYKLPEIENALESPISAFTELIYSLSATGTANWSGYDYDWRIPEVGIEIYDYRLSLNYETIKNYINTIDTTIKMIASEGNISKGQLEYLNQTMKNTMALTDFYLDRSTVPDSVLSSIDVSTLNENVKIHSDNIIVLEKNIKIINGNIEYYKNELTKRRPSQEAKITKLIKDAENSLVSTLNKIETEKKLLKKYISKSYKNEIAAKINNLQTWLDFFDGKNTTITEFLQLIDTSGMMQEELDLIIPMKDAPQYQKKLDDFLTGWGL